MSFVELANQYKDDCSNTIAMLPQMYIWILWNRVHDVMSEVITKKWTY